MRRGFAKSVLLVLAGISALALSSLSSAQEPDASVEPLKLSADTPSQEIYRGWPPDELYERLYASPWSHIAFNRAELLSRPVLFVLTVDWNRAAQKMAQETLSSPEVLRTINKGYVTVIVNADLRPDITERYRTGAWPVVAFLLPNGRPMLSQANDLGLAKPITTTLVPENAMLFLLTEGTKYWSRWPGLLMQVGDRWTSTEGPADPKPGVADTTTSDYMARWLIGNADGADGGFGASPKFLVHALGDYAALLEARGVSSLRRHQRLTLERLVAGGLYDSRDGGMHRIAAGPSFTQVEFEKMLEGNGALVHQLVGSLRQEDSEALRAALVGTAGFMTRVLGRPEGGFFLAQAADPLSDDGGGYWRNDPPGPAPPIDRLVLSGPNAAAGAALIRAGALLDDDALVAAGTAAAELVLDRAYRAGRGVFHVIEPFRDPRIYLTAQADVALAFTDAYEGTGDRRFLDAAQNIVDSSLAHLRSGENPMLLDHLPEVAPLGLLIRERRPVRPNVRMARAMIRLWVHGLDESYRTDGLRIISAFSENLSGYGVHGTEAAVAIEEAHVPPLRIAISGPADDDEVVALRRAALNSAWPWTIVDRGEADDRPGATISWEGKKLEIRKASAMQDGIARMTSGENP